MNDIYCLVYDCAAEKLIITPFEEITSENLIAVISGINKENCVAVGYTYGEEAAKDIIKNNKLESLINVARLKSKLINCMLESDTVDSEESEAAIED